MSARGQSTVVGVAVLLAVTMASIAVLTAGVGTVIDDAATAAEVDQVTDRLVTLFPHGSPAEARSGPVHVTTGTFATVERQFRVLTDEGVIFTRDVDALRYTSGTRQVTVHTGAVIRGTGDAARFRRPPALSVAADNGSRTVYLAVPTVETTVSRTVVHPTRLAVTVDATADRRSLPAGEYRIAFETTAVTPWRTWLESKGYATTVRDLDGDGVPSVVATIPAGSRVAIVVIPMEVHFDG